MDQLPIAAAATIVVPVVLTFVQRLGLSSTVMRWLAITLAIIIGAGAFATQLGVVDAKQLATGAAAGVGFMQAFYALLKQLGIIELLESKPGRHAAIEKDNARLVEHGGEQ